MHADLAWNRRVKKGRDDLQGIIKSNERRPNEKGIQGKKKASDRSDCAGIGIGNLRLGIYAVEDGESCGIPGEQLPRVQI